MKNIRLLQLLRTFDRKELQELKKFVAGPFFNQKKEVVALLDVLIPYIEKGKAPPDKKAVFRAVFGNRDFDDHRLRMSFSFLYSLARRYLTVKDFLESPVSYAIRESEVLRRRKLYGHARKSLEAGEEYQQAENIQNSGYFDTDYRLLLEKCRLDINEPGAKPEHFEQLSTQLDKAFLSRKLWQSCVSLSHQTFANTRFDPGILKPLLDGIEELPFMEIPAISIYYYCYRALSRPEREEYYFQFKNLLFLHGDVFPPEELRDLYLLAINFCIKQYNEGNPAFLREQFEFYRQGLERRYFVIAGELSIYTYLNAVTLALVLQELDWAENFIREYRSLLDPERGEGFFNFNKARLEYARGRLGNALQLLQKADYKELLIGLAAKTLQLKIFYESGETDLLDAHLHAMQAFLYRKKVMGYHRENYMNTIRFTRRLLETPSHEKDARAALRREIEHTGALAEKEWLLEQV